MNLDGQVALVTGASSGIGLSCAASLADAGAKVVVAARRAERLRELANRNTEKFHPVAMDVTDRQAVEEALLALPEPWAEVDILVNAAGLALGFDALQDGDPEDWDRMLDTNVKGPLNLIHFLVPGMVERGYGHVLTIGSSASRAVYPSGAVYCASKAAADRITAGLRLDLLGTGVRVTVVHPSRTQTEFHEVRLRGNREQADALHDEIRSLRAEDVAKAVLYAVEQPDHVNISDLLITPTDQAAHGYIAKRRDHATQLSNKRE